MKIIADKKRARLLENKDQCESGEHLIQMFAFIEIAKQKTLQQRAKREAKDNANRQRQPERPRRLHHHEGDVGADHEKAAMREIDDSEHAENQRQPAGDQKQQQSVLHAVQYLGEKTRHLQNPATPRKKAGPLADRPPAFPVRRS